MEITNRATPAIDHEAVIVLLGERLRQETHRSIQLETLAEQLLKERNEAFDRIEASSGPRTQDTTDDE